MKPLKFTAAVIISTQLISCASTTEQGAVGVSRKQMMLVSSAEVNQMADKAYADTKREAQAKHALDTNAAETERVVAISKRLIPHTAVFRREALGWPWEAHVIASPTLNAYCMPGGRIMFYSGIIQKLKLTDGEIAAIMGHEIAHALREHGRERISQQMLQQGTLNVLLATGKVNPNYVNLAGAGANVLLTLPHSRGQESEADRMGVELMARAGYDPSEAIHLWQKMAAASGAGGGSKPSEFMSTHPSDERRIRQIQELLPKVTPLYQQAIKP